MLKVCVPATSANLGPGFDTLGIALELMNTFYFCLDEEDIPPKGAKFMSANSLVQRGAELVAEETGGKLPKWQVALNAQIPSSRGLGSSASLTVAGIVAANHYLQAGLSSEKLLELACRLEGHPDNAAPALLGGLVVSTVTPEGVKFLKILPGETLKTVVAVPEFTLPTNQAREVLPTQVSYHDAIQNTGRTALFVSSMLLGDYTHLKYAMEDVLHQPYRMDLVPGFKEVMAAAIKSGALGSCLSGAGPSILAFITEKAEEVRHSMTKTWVEFGIKSKAYLLEINRTGVQCQEI